MLKKITLNLALITTIFASGCATIVSEKSSNVNFTSSPTDLEFVIKNESGMIVHKGKTPEIINLINEEDFYTVDFYKNGEINKTLRLKNSIDGWVWGNILFGGIIGLVIDFSTGAAYELPEHLHAETDGFAVIDFETLPTPLQHNLVKVAQLEVAK